MVKAYRITEDRRQEYFKGGAGLVGTADDYLSSPR